MLDYLNTRAIVRERYFDRKITIQLEGDNKKNLLDLIRRSMRNIHDDFKNLEVEEMIPCNCSRCRDDGEPYFFKYDSLVRRLDKDKSTIECDKSFGDVDVRGLLGEVIMPESRQSKNVFISYSHKDAEWLRRVKRHLKPLEKLGKIECWDDTQIKAGKKWTQAIGYSLQAARIALLLISADFYSSDFITEEELPVLLENAERRGTKVLSLIIKPSRFKRDRKLSQFQTINDPDKPLIAMREYQQEKVLEKMAEIIEDY